MRRLFMILLCCFALACPVLAENSITQMQTAVNITAQGDCQATISAVLHLDGTGSDISLLLPEGAKDVTVNGVELKPKANMVSLNDTYVGQTGDFSLNVRYLVAHTVHAQNDVLMLQAPMLPGFPYPIEAMNFTVTLPGPVSTQPAFTSGYHPDSVESDLSYTVNGATISGTITEPLRDHETMNLTMEVSEELFPQKYQLPSTVTFDWIGFGVCVALALLYWALTMAGPPVHRIRQTVPPAGLSAGELGNRLVRAPADLTMMVLTWAQLGYLIIQMDGEQVILYKKMDMGNERSAFESHWYRILFRRRTRENTGALRYAQLCKKVAASSPSGRELYRKSTGNPWLLRALAVLGAVFCGLGIGDQLTAHPIWRLVWMAIFAVLSGLGAWHIQAGAYSLHLRKQAHTWLALLATGIFIGLGLLGRQPVFALAAVVLSWLSGLAAAYTGHRSQLGQQTAGEILGLRYHLSHVSPQKLHRILHWNPNYFYDLAPYALALGVDRRFARSMGQDHLPPCGWFITELDTPRSAEEWFQLLRQAVDTMNQNDRRFFRQRFSRRR